LTLLSRFRFFIQWLKKVLPALSSNRDISEHKEFQGNIQSVLLIWS